MRPLFKLLGLSPNEASVRDPHTIERIAEALEELGPDSARYVAAFAYVLARVAHADWDISPEEVAVMEQLAAESAELSAEQARLVVEIARSQALALGASENYIVTRLYRDISTREQRLGLIECLFAVASADQDISTAENHEITIVANQLGLTHTEVTAVRSRFREHLAVLKNLPTKDAS
jgi:uncharacterized tellurite resistance protein B-like protein